MDTVCTHFLEDSLGLQRYCLFYEHLEVMSQWGVSSSQLLSGKSWA